MRILLTTLVTSLCLMLNLPAVFAAEEDPMDIAKKFGTPDVADIEYPDDEEPTDEMIDLGAKLFFDPRLSKDKTMSCATCHNPDLGFGDGMGFGHGVKGNKLGRNTPHIYNLAWGTIFMWDGRAKTLEEQALGPIAAEGEMNMDLDVMVKRLNGIKGYREEFESVFGEPAASKERVASAIAAFERTIIVDDTPFDRYVKGDRLALSPEAVRGLKLFAGKGKCIDCHSGPNFTDDSFHDIGVDNKDVGRGKFLKDKEFQGAFKTPGLRNVALTGPYMHDGSLASLEEVVRFYNDKAHEKTDSEMVKKLNLTDQEIQDLVAFMGALTQPLVIKRPTLPE